MITKATNGSAAYFARFKVHGFEPNEAAGFDEEFTRLAEVMGWQPDSQWYARHLKKAKSAKLLSNEKIEATYPQLPCLNMLAAYTPLSIPNFEQAPAYEFDV